MKEKLFTSFFLAVLSIGAWADSAVTVSITNRFSPRSSLEVSLPHNTQVALANGPYMTAMA